MQGRERRARRAAMIARLRARYAIVHSESVQYNAAHFNATRRTCASERRAMRQKSCRCAERGAERSSTELATYTCMHAYRSWYA